MSNNVSLLKNVRTYGLSAPEWRCSQCGTWRPLAEFVARRPWQYPCAYCQFGDIKKAPLKRQLDTLLSKTEEREFDMVVWRYVRKYVPEAPAPRRRKQRHPGRKERRIRIIRVVRNFTLQLPRQFWLPLSFAVVSNEAHPLIRLRFAFRKGLYSEGTLHACAMACVNQLFTQCGQDDDSDVRECFRALRAGDLGHVRATANELYGKWLERPGCEDLLVACAALFAAGLDDVHGGFLLAADHVGEVGSIIQTCHPIWMQEHERMEHANSWEKGSGRGNDGRGEEGGKGEA